MNITIEKIENPAFWLNWRYRLTLGTFLVMLSEDDVRHLKHLIDDCTKTNNSTHSHEPILTSYEPDEDPSIYNVSYSVAKMHEKHSKLSKEDTPEQLELSFNAGDTQ